MSLKPTLNPSGRGRFRPNLPVGRTQGRPEAEPDEERHRASLETDHLPGAPGNSSQLARDLRQVGWLAMREAAPGTPACDEVGYRPAQPDETPSTCPAICPLLSRSRHYRPKIVTTREK